MFRFTPLSLLAALLTLSLGGASRLTAAPNIVVILADDMDYPERQLACRA